MGFARRERFGWRLRRRELALGERTWLMGILNVTPDSFSDGGHFMTTQAAIRQGLLLLEAGADVLDIGGESTRPNATALTAAEEQARVLPVIDGVLRARPDAVLSIDTYHAETAAAAIQAGCEIVNDVSGLLWDAGMAAVVAEAQCGVVLMHTRGRPVEWMTQSPLALGDVVPHVLRHLRGRLAAALEAGIAADRVMLDPGFGFGIRGAENDELLAGFGELRTLGRPVLSGTSRKSFLTRRLAEPGVAALAAANAAAEVAAILAGAHMLRVHDLDAARAAAGVADAILANVNLST